jgi:hypothetical protein
VPPAVVPASAFQNGDTTKFRGCIVPQDLGHGVDAFFGSPTKAGSYDAMIVTQAQQAATKGATLFSVGTEPDSLAGDTDANVEKDWTDLIADVRTAAPGLNLAYAATWPHVAETTF